MSCILERRRSAPLSIPYNKMRLLLVHFKTSSSGFARYYAGVGAHLITLACDPTDPPQLHFVMEDTKLAKAAYASLSARLEVEQKAQGQATAAIHGTWRKIMRVVKTDELKAEAQSLSAEFERDLERRDAMTVVLVQGIADADALHDSAASQHSQHVDQLMTIQRDRLATLESDYQAASEAIQRSFSNERARMTAQHSSLRFELQHTLKAAREDEAAKSSAARAEFEQLRESMKRRNLERIHILQSDMDGAIEALERAFESAHLAYLQATDARTQDFKALSERGQHDTALNDRQQRALRRLNRLLQVWRSSMAHSVRESEGRNASLQTERDTLARHLDELKASMARARESTASRLKALCVHAQEAKTVLGEQIDLAQRILVQAELMRPLETDDEKADPFAASAGGDPLALTTSGAADDDDGVLPLAAEHDGDALQLRRFYGRLGKVQLDNHALAQQRAELRAEAAALADLGRQYTAAARALPSAVVGSKLDHA